MTNNVGIFVRGLAEAKVVLHLCTGTKQGPITKVVSGVVRATCGCKRQEVTEG